MADLFISYAHEDKPFVADLADALAAAGHTVWWDRSLDVGGAFRQQIQAELDAAALVLVAWSERSRLSRFVADEADHALARGRLLPLLIDGARPALGFGGLHAIDLSRWSRTADDAAFAALLQAVAQRLAQGAQPPAPRPAVVLWRPAGGLLGLAALALGLAQAAVQAARPGGQGLAVLRFGIEHALLSAVLLLPVAAWAVQRTRRLGLARWQALARPFILALAAGAAVALGVVALAWAAGLGAGQPVGQRLADGLASVLLAAPAVAALGSLLALARAWLRGR